ncbi:hypothetical protein [Pseudomonas lini]
MNKNIAGSEIHHSPSFAQTAIDQMGLPLNLHNELQVRLDKIHTDGMTETLVQHLVYAKGIVRGLEVAGAIGASQGVDLLEVFEKAYVQRDSYLRHGTASDNAGIEDQPK